MTIEIYSFLFVMLLISLGSLCYFMFKENPFDETYTVDSQEKYSIKPMRKDCLWHHIKELPLSDQKDIMAKIKEYEDASTQESTPLPPPPPPPPPPPLFVPTKVSLTQKACAQSQEKRGLRVRSTNILEELTSTNHRERLKRVPPRSLNRLGKENFVQAALRNKFKTTFPSAGLDNSF